MTSPFAAAAVVGLGTVGSALADRLRRAGIPVVGIEADEAALARGRGRVEEHAARAAAEEARDGGPDPGPRAAPDRIRYSTRVGDATGAELVIEAVPERVADKCEVLSRAHAVCPPRTVFATTTTGLSVTRIGAACGRLDRTVGLHVPDPASATGAVELAGTPVTDPAVLHDAAALVRCLGLVPVQVGDRAGFVAGGLLMGYLNSAVTMYERRYASRDDIDAAMRLGCGLPAGPLAHLDQIGLDAAHDALEALYERTADRTYAPAPLLAHMVDAGLLGRKTGRGFYDYAAADDPDPAPRHRSCQRPPAAGETPGGQARTVRRIGIVGSGTMATGIAEVCARSGYPTVLVARTGVKAKAAVAAVERSLDKAVRRGRIAPADLGATLDRLDARSEPDALGGCELLIEAAAEDLAVKRRLFAELDRAARPGAVLATTTSSLPVIACATATGRPEDVLGLHFFNPAPVMKLVEVASTVRTAPGAVATAQAVCAALGKHPVHCADRAGFIANALLFPYLNRAVAMLEDGYAGAGDIDAVMRDGLGYPMGPLALLDIVGLDVSLAIQRRLHEAFRDPALTPARYLEHLVHGGHLGRKTGRGFHAYPAA